MKDLSDYLYDHKLEDALIHKFKVNDVGDSFIQSVTAQFNANNFICYISSPAFNGETILAMYGSEIESCKI